MDVHTASGLAETVKALKAIAEMMENTDVKESLGSDAARMHYTSVAEAIRSSIENINGAIEAAGGSAKG